MGTRTRKILAISASSVVSGALLFGHFLLNPCGGFDPCPSPVFDLQTTLLWFALLSWLTVFPATVLTSRAMPRFLAPVVVTLLATALMALFDTPTFHSAGFIGSFVNIARQLSLPWLAGGIVAVGLWPNNSFKPRPLRGSAAW